VTPSSSDSSGTPSGDSSGGDSSGSDSSQQDPSAAKKEKIVAFLTADDGGLNGGVVTVNTDILSPFDLGISLENILMSSRATATYQSVGKKAASELVAVGSFLVEVGNAVVAYQELKTAMGSYFPPAPEGVDVTTEEGAVAYFKYFLEAMYSSMAEKQVTCDHKVENGFHIYAIEGSEGLSDATYIDEKTDKTDFYVYDSYEKVTRHGSAPLHTEDIHEIYRSPLGGNFMGYARTHLEKIEAAIVEDAASGVFTIKFSELAKDPDAAEVKVFGNSPLSYVPDLTVSFDASGSISGFAGSMEQAKTNKVEVKATLAKTGGSVTIPTNVVECDHSYSSEREFETEDGVGGHCHYCSDCHSVFDYGRHEYHQGDEHCHVCNYVATKEAAFKEGTVLPAPMADLKILEAKGSGNFIQLDGLDGFSRGVYGNPAEKKLVVEFETQVRDETNAYRVYAKGTQKDQEYTGCMVPMDFVVSYTLLDGEEHDSVVIYEKSCYWEYHETEPKKIDGMGDSCHVYSIDECSICGHEYGYPVLELKHAIDQQKNQDETITLTCANCHETAVARIGKIEDYGESHSVRYEYVSGNRELYEFFVEKNSWGMHQYQDGVCVVCGHESSKRQVVVDLSSYMGDGVTMTLNVNKDHETAPTAVSDEGRTVVPMSARNPDNGERISGFVFQGEESNYIVQCEKVETLVKDKTCEYEVSWKIAVYPVTMDPEERVYVISGPAREYPDPWDPSLKTIHSNTHGVFERQGGSCVYNVKDVCDACGETVHQGETTFHDIRVTQEGDNYRLTCEHCHEDALVEHYGCYRFDENHHFWVVDGDILEASDIFRKDLMGSAASFHFYNEEGDCLCGDHSNAHQTKFIWANHTNTGEVPDVVGGINFVRDKDGNPTSIELFGQGELLASDVAEPAADHMADLWRYEALDSKGEKVGVITVTESYVPYEDGFVKNKFAYELNLDEEHESLSSYWDYNPLQQSQPDYQLISNLIVYHFEQVTTASGTVTYEYEGEGLERHPVAIGAEGLGDLIPELTNVFESGGWKRDVTVWAIKDKDGNPLNYCFISENRYGPGEDEEWVLDAHVYYISEYEPDNIPSSILYLSPTIIDSIAVVH